jgi:glucokinase
MVEGTLVRVAYNHEAKADMILEKWAAALNETLSKVDQTQVTGIGFAIPGPFDYRNGISKMEHKFRHLYDLHIPSELNKLLVTTHDLPMRFLNDATAFAVGEAWLGQGRGHQKVVVGTLGTGFGSAFLDGSVPIVTRADVPKEGCLWYLPYRDGIADDFFSTRWFTKTWQTQTGMAVDGVKDLVELAKTDPKARELFDTFGHNLSDFLAPWLSRFGADILILGGNIAHAFDLFGPALQGDLSRQGVTTQVAISQLEEHAALIGSARLMDEAFWVKVSAELPAI